MKNSVNMVHEYIWGRLYDDCTGMFYNHLASLDDSRATKYLPDPESVCIKSSLYKMSVMC